MERYLLFDSGCHMCSSIARVVEGECSGWLTVRSLREVEMQKLLAQVDPRWKWTPTLVEVSDQQVHIFTGWRMRLRLLQKLGLPRSLRLLTSIATNTVQTPSQSRRRLLKGGGLLAIGMGLGAGLWPKSVQGSPRKEPDQPGSLPKSEGVTSYTLIERDDNENTIRIHFTHVDPSKSGIVEAIGRKEKEVELRLIRSEEEVALLLNRYEPEFTIRDKGGRRSKFTLVEREWKSEKQDGLDIIASNKDNIAVLCSIYSEFEIIAEPLPTSSASAATGAQTLLTCPCSSGSNRVRGTSGVYTFRSEACAAATSDMNRRCFNSFCTACCNSLECDCVCAGSPLGIDYICSCGRIGYFCTGTCT